MKVMETQAKYHTVKKLDNGKYAVIANGKRKALGTFLLLSQADDYALQLDEIAIATGKPLRFKKVRTSYKGFIILQVEDHAYKLYTKDEWEYGEGYRTIEWEAGNMQEARDFIDCY